jgi:hypothetical protein
MAGVMSNQNGKKPFSYCPGGIDFSQLKSPKMAKRIARHQAQQEKDQEDARQLQGSTDSLVGNTQTLPANKNNLTSQANNSQPKPTYQQSNTTTLPSRPMANRQRSLTDLFSFESPSNTGATPTRPLNNDIFNYNPYADNRNLYTPPPVQPAKPVDPINRSNSLPPSGSNSRHAAATQTGYPTPQ